MAFETFLSALIVSMFFGPLAVVSAYGLCQFHLALNYRRGHKSGDAVVGDGENASHENDIANQFQSSADGEAGHAEATDWPAVTVQLPVYNEMGVVERLIDAVAKFDYPRDRLQIQVLDDSTDDTVALIAARIEALRTTAPDLQISHIQRPNRVGYKAGALDYGLQSASGEFIAIFDADFAPHPSYLKDVMPYFVEENVAVVQARWHHANETYSLLTRIQAFMLDAHFSCEQFGRMTAGCFSNFNGTAGIWRRSAIEDAGGWQHDTLTEDIDLSYRAQLKGWRIEYLEDVGTASELPITMDAVRSQQFRWTKGIAEVGRKCLLTVWRSPISLKQKIHAGAHLLLSLNYVSAFTASVMSIPLLVWMQWHPEISLVVGVLSAIVMSSMLAFAFFFWTSRMRFERTSFPRRLFKFMWLYPCFLSYYLALSFHNSLAAIEGFLGIRSPFVRTPKPQLGGQVSRNHGYQYVTAKLPKLFWFELLLLAAFVGAIIYGSIVEDYRLMPYHLQLAFGFAMICFFTVQSARQVAEMQRTSLLPSGLRCETARFDDLPVDNVPDDIPTDTRVVHESLHETTAETPALESDVPIAGSP